MDEKDWRFEITLVEQRPHRTIIEGTAHKDGRTYYDELFFYILIGLDFIRLDTIRDFPGETLIEHFKKHFGDTRDSPRIEIGGSLDEENSTFLVADWDFPRDKRAWYIEALNTCLAQKVLPPTA